ncbi:MAG: triple tyrosine motif-containing protein, partial [Ginsengibacter sp.]
DKKGDLWFGNYYGLSQLPNNKTKKNTQGSPFINYTPEHGFQGIGSLTNSICQSSDGLIWIGCADRLTVFDPENLKPDTTLPNVQLTAISLFNEKISWVNDSALILNNGVTVAGFTFDKLSKWYNIPENLSLAYNNNFISFHFVGININTPQNIKYQYILEGLEKNWSTTTSLSEASYGNLSPGSYIFKVKSKNGDGNWSEPVAYPFRIRPPWWRTWWAWLIYSIIIIGLVYAFIRFRINQERQKVKILEAIRTKISSDLHDDVGSILSGLAMQSQVMAYSAKEDQKEGLNEISNMSREAMEVMRDTVWAMDSRKDKFENLIDRMRAFAEKNLNRKNITHEFAIEDIDGKKFINPEKRQTIYLIFKEAITNIIKHCDGSHVIIKFAYSKNSLYLLVHDNGSEKAACNSDGLGLSNMKMRAEKIGGTLNTKFSNGFMVELKV